ncbi:MAG: sugar phosphate nucleotidyltransferase, partial [Halorubrum sp.]
MYGVVLAAGRGTRMRPLTDRRPKPLLPVGDRSLLERVFDTAIDVVDEFVVVTGYRGAAIRESIGESYRGHPVTYVRQAEANGTAHAVAQAAPVVDDDFLVLNGDVVVDASLPRALADAKGTAVAATEVVDPRAYGVLSTATDGTLAGIVEKPADPPTNLANVGCYAFESGVFEYIDRTPESERGEHEITTTIDLLLADGHRIDVAPYEGTWLDVGRPWELLMVNEMALGELTESGESVAGTVEEG